MGFTASPFRSAGVAILQHQEDACRHGAEDQRSHRSDRAAFAGYFAGDALRKQLGPSALHFSRLHGVC